ncbi:MAG: DUF354 domain-containing protein [Alteromonadaceae bacterium]|nr:DUF354 domain-containing protein [Alteromonadaceae bacterium]
MKILIDINHPAHVHFFKMPAKLLQDKGHQIVFSSRDKDVTLALLNELGLESRILSKIGDKGMFSLAKELVFRNYSLYKLTKEIKPDVLAAVGGTFVAHVGTLSRIPSVVFYDTENAKLQNLITYPFASKVVVPSCYQAWLPKHHIKYPGYHELSYLHPDYFSPSQEIARQNGIDVKRRNIFIRLVSWQANHDVGETGWSTELLSRLISEFSKVANIIISSEIALQQNFEPYLYKGEIAQIHHVMAYCDVVVGESATMASEAAVMGVPAIYAAETGRGYTDEQEAKFDLVSNIRDFKWHNLKAAIYNVLDKERSYYKARKSELLESNVDVAAFAAETILEQASV